METYTNFARVYDIFMDNIPYDQWAQQNISIMKRYGIKGGIVADLGCGTGSLTERLAAAGFDMIGIDSASSMLEIAEEKRQKSGHSILYLLQDMREFELYGTCAAIVSRCDAINYLADTDELVQVFKLVNNYLDPDGIFIFDCNTLYKYKNVLAENTIAENRSCGSFIWENSFDEEQRINEYDLTLYVRDDFDPEAPYSLNTDENAIFKRYEETHFQKAFTLEEIKKAAQQAGLKFLEALDAQSLEEPTKKTLRYLIVLGESGKKK